jgi:hypothetical protein
LGTGSEAGCLVSGQWSAFSGQRSVVDFQSKIDLDCGLDSDSARLPRVFTDWTTGFDARRSFSGFATGGRGLLRRFLASLSLLSGYQVVGINLPNLFAFCAVEVVWNEEQHFGT